MHAQPEPPPAADGGPDRPPGERGAAARRPRLWLIAGTGEGPPLAAALLACGWRLRVSVVTAAAARAYPAHADLEMAIGALGAGGGEGARAAIARELQEARLQADPFHWLVDASHPFAQRVSASLAAACAAERQPLLRLRRQQLPQGGAVLLDDLAELPARCCPGERLLLAIGARRLAEAISATPTLLHHARVLPSPQALRQALAAGLATDRLACLRPGPTSLAIELALCRRWRIDTVLCRQSGGENEGRWHRISAALGLRLLLLRRPAEPAGVLALEMPELLERLAAPPPV